MALEKKQKILLPLIVVAFAYVAWQVYDIFFAGASSAPHPVARVTSARPPQQSSPVTPVATNPVALNVSPQPVTQPKPKPSAQRAMLTAEQAEYLRLMNRYNLLKLKHLLLDEEAAIVAAKQKIVKSRVEISDVSGGEDWFNDSDFGDSSQEGYKLVYLDYQNGRWSALLSRAGRFHEVSAGMRLVNDDKVMSVSKRGVTLRHDDEILLLSFDGTRVLSKVKKTEEDEKNNEALLGNTQTQSRTERRAVSNSNVEKKIVLQPLEAPKPKPLPVLEAPAKLEMPKPKQMPTEQTPTASEEKINQKTSQKHDKMKAIHLAQKTPNEMPLAVIKKPTEKEDNSVAKTPPSLDIPQPEKSTSNSNKDVNSGSGSDAPSNMPEKKSSDSTSVMQSQLEDAKQVSNSEKALLAMDDAHYTLQLLGMYNKKDLEDFINTNQLDKNKAFIFETNYLDKDWYILVYGDYKTYDEGLAAIKTLPSSIQILRPWVRSLVGVKNMIKKNIAST